MKAVLILLLLNIAPAFGRIPAALRMSSSTAGEYRIYLEDRPKSYRARLTTRILGMHLAYLLNIQQEDAAHNENDWHKPRFKPSDSDPENQLPK